jgi:Holliday junction resolvase RusA-like endonuclease
VGRRAPLKDDIEVWITVYLGTKRKGDWDNYHKLSMDALNGVVRLDDNQGTWSCRTPRKTRESKIEIV